MSTITIPSERVYKPMNRSSCSDDFLLIYQKRKFIHCGLLGQPGEFWGERENSEMALRQKQNNLKILDLRSQTTLHPSVGVGFSQYREVYLIYNIIRRLGAGSLWRLFQWAYERRTVNNCCGKSNRPKRKFRNVNLECLCLHTKMYLWDVRILVQCKYIQIWVITQGGGAEAREFGPVARWNEKWAKRKWKLKLLQIGGYIFFDYPWWLTNKCLFKTNR